jgi:hypothetical protein
LVLVDASLAFVDPPLIVKRALSDHNGCASENDSRYGSHCLCDVSPLSGFSAQPTGGSRWVAARAPEWVLHPAGLDPPVRHAGIVRHFQVPISLGREIQFAIEVPLPRRIDLLGVDSMGHLVVFELKRTTDGGHLELQALRYAAMVSVTPFDDLAEHYKQGPPQSLGMDQPAS